MLILALSISTLDGKNEANKDDDNDNNNGNS